MSEEGKSKVKGPGIALMIVGILSLITNLISAIMNGLTLAGRLAVSDWSTGELLEIFLSGGWSTFAGLVGFLIAFIIIYAGVSLQKAKSTGVVYAGAIFAMIPCCSGCCCILGLPIGIWALITLQDDEVKKAFAEVDEAYY
jgi:hypothetical protein